MKIEVIADADAVARKAARREHGSRSNVAQSILPLLGLPIPAVGDLRRKLEAVSVSAISWSRVRLETA
jgi:hypothetical protein